MIDEFKTEGYQRHNRCRQEHLASLGLSLRNKLVLEVGAGVGDHTGFWLERGCWVTCIEAREENAKRIRAAHPSAAVAVHDLDSGDLPESCRLMGYDVVYAYGILYHLAYPGRALKQWARVCSQLLLLETCVNTSVRATLQTIPEAVGNPTAGFSGVACRPSRSWVFRQLQQGFPYVYMPITQPDHEEFPLDWNNVTNEGNVRAVFVASRQPLDNALLVSRIPMTQTKYQ